MACAGLACAGAVALAVLLAGTPGGGSQPEFAAAALEVAEANPRLLVTEPGWSVIGAEQFKPDEGSIFFSDGAGRSASHLWARMAEMNQTCWGIRPSSRW